MLLILTKYKKNMKKLKIGDKVNDWIVYDGPFIINDKTFYDMQCSICGKIYRFDYRYIIRPTFSKSCRSCSQKKRREVSGVYRKGDKVVNLTILGPKREYKNNTYYQVQCDCGHIYYTGSSKLSTLKSGRGLPYCPACYSIDKKSHKRNTMFSEHISQTVFNHIHKQAILRGIKFDLTPQYLEDLLQKQSFKCALSGIPLTLSLNLHTKEDRKKHTASLDRINSNVGYVEGNIQWVHKDINYMKCDFTQEEFIEYCNKVSNLHANQQLSTK